MEKEQELTKLVNVLRQTARVASQSDWAGSDNEAAEYCVAQYNRILKRLNELDSTGSTFFETLPEGSSLKVAAIACRQLAAYYRDEVKQPADWQSVCGADFDPKTFRDLWRKGTFDIQDLGEAIRESIQTWAARQKTNKHKHRHWHKPTEDDQ